MKILLFFGGIGSLSDAFYLGFKTLGHEVRDSKLPVLPAALAK